MWFLRVKRGENLRRQECAGALETDIHLPLSVLGNGAVIHSLGAGVFSQDGDGKLRGERGEAVRQ